ncbi:putative membrane protein [Wickerhamomyces ciferrii]|uniref:Membrane protein n=1 Tax=Wickerhamomyces ciferrii (strain ATCC 14091 / BCRC 22168 / CBS 111 / JCM 3599 / NBRC 0793 / NRRL Y-1031 F-60-10) TaxID=1206466 RepID=K0KMV0_WICCF|nr:uncharacterized protein BN7_3099 [Wickerhamomyces ciferrii]CCH43547.1 putative membrane protein [Wickerhamomyces ciferrii]
MLFLWTLSGIPFSIFFVSRDANIPIQIQPQCFTILCLITWIQTLYYPPINVKPRTKLVYYAGGFVLISLVVEIGFIIPLKRLYKQGITWPSLIFGILASILLVLGLLPPYFELSKRQGQVIGINFIFLTLDFLGAFCSALSVGLAKELDILGIVIYCIVGIMELGIFTSHFIWWIRIGRKKEVIEESESEVEEVEESDVVK